MNKNDLRILYQKKRNELSEEQIQLISKKIGENLFQHFNFNGATVSFYLPIKQKKEIDTLLIINSIPQENVKLVYPIWDEKTNQLEHYIFNPNKKLHYNNFGIPYQNSIEKIKNSEIDFVITPLLAIDIEGYRVGYGKGVYDIFFENQPKKCTKIGLHFFELIPSISDRSILDIPLDYCVTPSTVIHFEKKS